MYSKCDSQHSNLLQSLHVIVQTQWCSKKQKESRTKYLGHEADHNTGPQVHVSEEENNRKSSYSLGNMRRKLALTRPREAVNHSFERPEEEAVVDLRSFSHTGTVRGARCSCAPASSDSLRSPNTTAWI